MLIRTLAVSAAIVAASGQAMAADGHGGGRGGSRGSGHSGYRGGSNIRVGFGFSDCGSGVSFGFGNSYCGPSRSYCAPRYYGRSYCAAGYWEPVYIGTPYYTEPTVLYQYPATTVVTQPVQPVVIQQPVVVQAQQPTAQQQLAQQPVTIQPALASSNVQQPQQPAQQETQQQGRYQDRELGDAYVRMNDPDNAARVYKRYLSVWNGDGTVTRNLGFAQIDRGETQDGFKSVVQGYRLEKDLIKRPIRMEDLGGKIGYERLLDASAKAAAGSNTAEGWLTVALLQHTGGQHEAAVSALQHARDSGLDEATLDQFTLEIGKPAK
jgi:hypothetical protein